MRYKKSRAITAIDWSTIDFVVGTRDDVTETGINRPCSRCNEPVFTSRHYPKTVSMVCEYCALAIAEEEEAAGRTMSARVSLPSMADAGPLLDPWQRTLQPQPRAGRAAAPRRRLARPARGPGPSGGEGAGA